MVALYRLACHDTPLSILLIASPLLGLAVVPGSGFAAWRGRFALTTGALAGAGAWLLITWAVCGNDHILILTPLLGQLWCAAGVGTVTCAVAMQVDRLPVRWARLPVMACLCLFGALVVLPLNRLYRIQVAPAHLNEVFASGEVFDLEGADGQRLRCRWSSPSSPKGVVVFTHGIGGSFSEFVGIHLLFAREGWAVFDWNLRGHGDSAPAATTYGLREGDDLVRVWAEARRRAGGLPMVAYGASLGAGATLLAGLRLEGCGGMILESSFAELASLIGPNLPGPLAISARLLATWGLGMDIEAARPIDRLAKIRNIPVLLGTALDDRIVPPDHGLRLAGAAPWATHLALPGRGHMDLAYDPRWMSAVTALLQGVAVDHGAIAAPR